MLRAAGYCLTILVMCFSPAALKATEPWADPKLPMSDGLELWLDAGRQPQAPANGKALETWFDASGRGRHLRQPTAAARPRFVRVGDDWLVRCDGVDDHLRLTGQSGELSAFTVVIVAAPRSNLGGFRGLLAFNAPERRDYESGITIDLSIQPRGAFSDLNVEGRGFQAARNLLRTPQPFGTLHTLEVHSDGKSVRLVADGVPAGERPRTGEPLSLAEITVGARYYTNGSGPQAVRGFADADIAEVLVYSRSLSDPETQQLRQYLDTKYARLKRNLPPIVTAGTPLVRVPDPPPVQVFVPGFTVRELPVTLPNVNNVKYRPDGTLVALCYNGDVYHLRDSDGDGVEDKATLFWDNKGRLRAPIGMDLTPPGYKHGTGLFVAAKGKCSLIVDTDGDGVADREIIVADGWKEPQLNVDALGVAYDRRDGSVWFGRGTPNFTNAYLIDKDGKAGYSLADERGTIMRVSPDFKTREIMVTGIRFPVALAFNRHGDLFATDQEGATWLPNGNPFDELLHIERGRHYGFPPRHPKHLPNVIDEPSVFDYGPQHQSTCGLCFNEPVNPGGAIVGPAGWAGDALIAGYSRGKLYRTQLVKTPAGYVARNQILACLNMLTLDCCVAPDGSLLVACHSGQPDWGSGPTGIGKLYKITYTDRDHPQPVAVWPTGPREVRVAFDRPVDPALLREVAKKATLTAGRYVRAGDRFESLRPGYAVVAMELTTPRFDVPIHGAQLTPDRRTLILVTDPHPGAVHYALTLPGMGRPEKSPNGTLRQVPQIDLDYDLTGAEATWTPDGGHRLAAWLPHLDTDVARGLTADSATHDAFWQASGPGSLAVRAQLDLTDMLRPVVQPGSRIDYEWPAEEITLTFHGSAPVSVRCPVGKVEHQLTASPRLTLRPKAGELVPAEIDVRNASGPPYLQVSYHTAEDQRERALPLRRILVPWATAKSDSLVNAGPPPLPPELHGGSWSRGRAVFFGDQAGCAKCHSVHGHGGAIGPDLSNLVHRDYASVLRDVTDPNAAINPDYVTYVVTLTDGRVRTGTVRNEGDRMIVGDPNGRESTVTRVAVEEMHPVPHSVMPAGLPQALGPDKTRDLFTFLLSEPRMPDYGREAPPRSRSKADVRAVLAGAPSAVGSLKPLRIVLIAGKKDHGPGEHDYPAWQKVWAELLAAADKVSIETAWDWPSPEQFQKADVLVFYQRGDWTPERARDIDPFLARGGGLVYLHYAVDGQKDPAGFAKRIGLAWGPGAKFRHGPVELDFRAATNHPIARNFKTAKFVDETYWQLGGELKPRELLATGVEEEQPQPLFWTREHDRGRVFVTLIGHYAWTFDDPLFRVLLLRGIAWSAHEPVDRINDLVWPGARVAD
jgi:putative heme-binding domain-containing protein